MKNISITFDHGCSVVFDIDQNYFIIEIERLSKHRYDNIHRIEKAHRYITQSLDIAKKFYDIDNDFDFLTVPTPQPWIWKEKRYQDVFNIVKSIIRYRHIKFSNHHESHAACAAYQSPYNNATVISFDGSGNDGVFNVYSFTNRKIIHRKKVKTETMGKTYRHIGYLMNDIQLFKGNQNIAKALPIPGKLMGLVAYGKVRNEWIAAFDNFFETRNTDLLSEALGFPIHSDENVYKIRSYKEHNTYSMIKFSGELAYDLAATNQYAWENKFFRLVDPILKESENIILTGGCALNVLLNEKVRKKYGDRVFVAPNSDDSGLALGQIFLLDPPQHPVDVTYNGLPILDIELLDNIQHTYNKESISVDTIASLLQQGKIIGILRGNSEIGPRALGNRSIICDPRYPNMKDKLNKIKNREWFRPFAPMVRYEDRDKYFDFSHESRFMSFSPTVRKEYQSAYPSITHHDGTARVQTVKPSDNKFIYDLLTAIDGLILNTSFNINGQPMLTTVKDALYVLDNTSLDYVIINDTLISKKC